MQTRNPLNWVVPSRALSPTLMALHSSICLNHLEGYSPGELAINSINIDHEWLRMAYGFNSVFK